jgi:hypothetical protein
MSHTGGGIQQYGGSPPPFDPVASEVLGRMRGAMQPQRPMVPLTPEERAEAEQAAADRGKVCRFCIAIHPLPNGPGCPRLLTFKLDGDGNVIEGTYRADDLWQARVVLVEDAHEEGTEQEAGDGSH